MMISKEISASSDSAQWQSIDWKPIESHVLKLQMRIAKATREGKHGKAKALQWILTHSRSAKLLAVRRVSQNKGSKTPGIDDFIWNTDACLIKAVNQLSRKAYKAQPLKRIYIPKKNGKLRPLGIPCMIDRAQQALHLPSCSLYRKRLLTLIVMDLGQIAVLPMQLGSVSNVWH